MVLEIREDECCFEIAILVVRIHKLGYFVVNESLLSTKGKGGNLMSWHGRLLNTHQRRGSTELATRLITLGNRKCRADVLASGLNRQEKKEKVLIGRAGDAPGPPNRNVG